MVPAVSALKSKAAELGFDLCGIARADRHPKLSRLAEWIAQGRAGEMSYLIDSASERLDVTQTLSSARSVISVALLYNTDHAYSSDPSGDGASRADAGRVSVSRYAWGDDYHGVVRARLRALLQWLSDQVGPGLEALTCVDDGPVQERVYAEAAGLGWIGKNTCLINPTLGSWLFLGEIVTNLDLEPDAAGVDQCGTCTRCLDACPTEAFVAPYELDATRCLSYLTIEVRGAVDEALRPAIREQVYGCDICQDVCPWNRRAGTSDADAWQPKDIFRAPKLIDLCHMSDQAWVLALKGSAMKRAGLHRLKRSLAYAAASAPVETRRAALDALRAQPSSHAAVVREAIDWAEKISD
ncbi:MAG: tRNA epoxyqueuosine(34) reductase QueG [Acidobacteria bacterium]|nr:tRNA epoxyqueuosine(34) reductase QueG [Acidobacteriota bacterium]